MNRIKMLWSLFVAKLVVAWAWIKSKTPTAFSFFPLVLWADWGGHMKSFSFALLIFNTSSGALGRALFAIHVQKWPMLEMTLEQRRDVSIWKADLVLIFLFTIHFVFGDPNQTIFGKPKARKI